MGVMGKSWGNAVNYWCHWKELGNSSIISNDHIYLGHMTCIWGLKKPHPQHLHISQIRDLGIAY